MLAAIVLMSSGLYVGLAKTVFTDMIFSVLILLTLLAFYWGYERKSQKALGIFLAFIFSALAVLTKGPLGFLIPGAVIFFFLGFRRELNFLRTKSLFLGFIIFLLIALPWYFFCTKVYGSAFTHEFFYNDHVRRLLSY